MNIVIALCLLFLAACAAPSAAPTASNKIFTDDFSNDSGLWKTFDDGAASAAIGDGRLTITIGGPSTVGLSLAAINLADFDLTVATTQTGGGLMNGYGVIFRYLDEENFYRFDIASDGLWSVSRRQKDQWTHMADFTPSPAIQTGYVSNTLRVVAKGSQFEFYANGTLLGRAVDSSLPVGRIALFASTFEDPNTQVSFDDLRIVMP